MAITIGQFVERLTESGLMTAQEVEAFQRELPAPPPRDVQQLAQALVKLGKLTKYQVQAVYQGKTKGLAFGEYVVLDKLGEGGMGVVLKAQHRRMKRLVAVKMIAGKAIGSPDAVKRFYREVEAAAKLNHANIVQAYDAGEHEGMHYLAMEHIEGRDLASVVHQGGPLGVREAVECVLQAARGLQYAHGRGVVHRDIKPGNLLLDNDGTVKILDMGLARFAGAEMALGGAERLTSTGQVMGTCDYMAPEQAEDTHAADHRADIYALGCTLHRLLTGRPPYPRETLVKILLAHREAPIPSLRAARPEAPVELDACFQRMLAKQPEDRQQSMAEVVAELEAVLRVLSGQAATVGPRSESSSAALSKTLEFLEEVTPPPLLIRPKKKTVAERRTQPQTSPELDTGMNVLGKARQAVARFRRKPLVLAGAAGGLLVLVVVLTILLRGGSAPSPVDEPTSSPLPLAGEGPGVRAGGDAIVPGVRAFGSLVGTDGKWRLPAGAPPPAVAPFDAAQARKHQEAWAQYLGVPIEITNSIGMKLVLVPPGEFMMGDAKGEDAEKPVHRVKITKPFYLGKYEVTQDEWTAVMTDNPAEFKGGRNPVENVSWDDCQEFLKRLSEKCGAAAGSYRLPTEAQWEYACRAGNACGWSFGNDASRVFEYGWYAVNAVGWTYPVGERLPNAWGLHDVHGNVYEWCHDWHELEYYRVSEVNDPVGPATGTTRVRRGGSFRSATAEECRSATRGNTPPNVRRDFIGLRVCLVMPDGLGGRTTAPSTEHSVPSARAAASAPRPAFAPFDATEAKAHQDAWAKHLGVPVEITNSIGMKLVLIPPGEFMMGSPKELIEEELKAHGDGEWYAKCLPWEGPRHRVRITKPFRLGMYEVTQEEYQRVMGSNPSTFSATGTEKHNVSGQDTKRFPVDSVVWDEAEDYCRRLSNLPEERAAGRTYRLPSEAQWEHACRAGSTGRYSFSFDGSRVPKESEEQKLLDYGWFDGNSDGQPHAVGGKRPNAWGLYDMHGNVWELCQDWYDKNYYSNAPTDDPAGPPGGSERMRRGGGFRNSAWYSRSACRHGHVPFRLGGMGFRVCLVLPGESGEPTTAPRPEHSVAGSPAPAAVAPIERPRPAAAAPLPTAGAAEPRSLTSLPAVSGLVGADGKWQLPPGAPPPAVAPFDPAKAKEHQAAWAKHLAVPVEITNPIGMKLVLIPPGEFTMGDDGFKREKPAHKVRIAKPFYLGKCEVTQAEWEMVMGNGSNPSAFKGPAHPVGRVGWNDCQGFLTRLAEKCRVAKNSYRLPTEAQWEYACRAGSATRWYFGDDESELADFSWCLKNSQKKAQPAGQKRPNAWGLHDLYGNVSEWCADKFSGDYSSSGSPDTDPLFTTHGMGRVIRGGSLFDPGQNCRSSSRNYVGGRELGQADTGFRVCLVPAD